MIDNVRHSPTALDSPSDTTPLVTLDVVSARFIAAGLPRSMRTLQRYCGNGTLECVKEATETGDTFFVHEHSIAIAIAALKQLHEAKNKHRHVARQRDVERHDDVRGGPIFADDVERQAPAVSDTVVEELSDRHGAPQADRSGHVAQLEHRVGEKDDEIAFLREELIDRRGQIRDMKGIIDGQNQLLEVINANVAPIFKALASTVESKKIDMSSLPHESAGTIRDAGQQDHHMDDTHAD